MTKQEAIAAMHNGAWVRHDYFSADEKIHMKGGVIYDENDFRMECVGANNTVIDFWTDRQGAAWETGWSIVENEFVKPKVKLIGEDGNVFNLLAICQKALKKAGYPEKAYELIGKVMDCKSYNAALVTFRQYCEVY